MNQNPEDPNNHVPPITPGDDWDDLDETTDRSRVGLPPRRIEHGLPPKKESLAEKVNLKTRMMTVGSDMEDPPADSFESGDAEGEDPEKSVGKSRRARNKPVRRAKAEKEEAEPEEPAPPREKSQEVAVILPLSKMGKRGRVKEINPGGDRPSTRQADRPAAIVARVPSAEPDAEAKDGNRKRRRFLRGERHDWGANVGAGSMKWMLLTGLAVGGLVVLAVVMNQRPKNQRMRSREQSLYSTLAPAEDEITGGSKATDGIDKLLNSRPQAESIFASYARAKSPDDFMGLVHAPARNRELIESEWKPLGMDEDWSPGSESTWYVKDGKGIRFTVLEGLLANFTPFRAIFRQDEQGGLKMDWKATTGYGSADFADLKSGKGDGSEVRVWLSPADFYTFSFPEGEYRSFRVMSPKADMTIWGYVPVGSELAKELLELFRPGHITGETNTEVQAVLSLVPSDGDSLPEQWLIKDMVRTDWLDE